MRPMFVLAAVAALSLTSVSVTRAAADSDAHKTEMKGVLIDNHCGEDMANKADASAADIQKDAAAHKKGCALKCAKDSGLSLMSDGKMMKLDKESNDKAMDYLKAKKHGTSVAVEASKNDDGTLHLDSIEPAKKADKNKEETK